MTPEVLPRRLLRWTAAGFGLWLAFGVLLNPLFSDQYQQANAVLTGEAVVALVLTAVAFVRAAGIDAGNTHAHCAPDLAPPPAAGGGRRLRRVGAAHEEHGSSDDERSPIPALSWRAGEGLLPTPVTDAPGSPGRRIMPWLALALVFLATLYLHRWELAEPRFIDDDRINLAIAQRWESTRDHLFRPFNEHLLVPTRLWAFAAVQLTTPETLPYWLLAGIWTLYGAALLQLFLLARREFAGDGPGLLAVAAFSLTYVYHECLWWFMAAQWLWTLNLLLAVWLVLDPKKPTAARGDLAAVGAFLGPFTFSIGLLVGPCAALWIAARWGRNRGVWWRPLVGTALGLLATAPLIAYWLRKDDPGNYNVQLKWFELSLWQGLGTTARLMVDHLIGQALGISPAYWFGPAGQAAKAVGLPPAMGPPLVDAALFPLIAAVPIVVLMIRPACWRLAPFALLIVLNYGIVIPFRSWMDYPQMANWTARYHLLPYLGLVLFLVGAWYARRPTSDRHSLTGPLVFAAFLFIYKETTHGRWQWP